jgi:peptide/nickel transport system ATP-binding protein
MHPVLSIQNLSIRFAGDGKWKDAVKDISIDIEQNKITAIVGESGSGKSVTALSVLRLLPKQASLTGKIIFYNKDLLTVLTRVPVKDLVPIRGNQIAMIFQEPMTSLNPLFTCGYQVMEVLRQHQKISKKEARQKVLALFSEVEFDDPASVFNRYPHQISGGQKQRVMIAMAISCSPSLLIADEPTTALDVTVQKSILELLKKIQSRNNMAILLITHDLGLVADVADELFVFYQGSVVEKGMATDVLRQPKHPYTKALLACRPQPNSKGRKLPVMEDLLSGKHKPGIIIKPTPVDTGHLISPVPLLSVEGLKVSFPVSTNFFGKTTRYFPAVDGVSFHVKQQETVGLVGESGCGKTTLGRAILQLVNPTAGRILLRGNDLSRLTEKEMRKERKEIQVVFQDPYGSLNPRLTIGEAIAEPMKVHGLYSNANTRKERTADLLQQVRLDADLMNRYPHQFSGGQRQRVCIARALAVDPSFIIFDESVSALDVSIQAQVLNLISELRSAYKFTSIFISHDLAVVHYISDRILVMQSGKIVEEGTAEQVLFHPTNQYTLKLVSSVPGKLRLPHP